MSTQIIFFIGFFVFGIFIIGILLIPRESNEEKMIRLKLISWIMMEQEILVEYQIEIKRNFNFIK